MKRVTINFILACISFILFLCLGAAGSILRYVLPCGRGYGWRGGRGADQAGQNIKEFWSMTRHQWLDFHFWIAISFAIVIIIHILLHWNWIVGYVKSLATPSSKLQNGTG